jgi:hypothetical protein
MLGNLFKKISAEHPPPTEHHVVAQLNCRVQPMHRGEFFEDPLEERLRVEGLGTITGGGTLQKTTGEIEHCDVEVQLKSGSMEVAQRIIALLEELGAPKGSKLHVESSGIEIPFGRTEGLAIYLNGTDLPDEVYESCDSNVVYDELDRLAAPGGRVLSYWQGPTETAFYLYGESFAAMQSAIEGFVSSYPLCQRARIERVA